MNMEHRLRGTLASRINVVLVDLVLWHKQDRVFMDDDLASHDRGLFITNDSMDNASPTSFCDQKVITVI